MESARNDIGWLFIIAGYACWVVLGIWAMIVNLAIVALEWGFTGAVVAFFVFPVTYVVAPIWAIIKYGNWFPLILGYGSVIVGYGLFALGMLIRGERDNGDSWY